MTNLKNLRIFNANTIKFLAAFCMVIDHVGLMFFPTQLWFRAVGRLSMPLFAFAISEGCRYTRNKIKHFAMLFGLGAICQTVFYIYSGDTYFNILLTFSLSVLNIYALQHLKKCIFENKKWNKLVPAMLIFLFCVAGTAFVCHIPKITIDYGFWGCMMPVFASLFDFRGITATPTHEKWQKLDCLPVRVLCMGVGILMLCLTKLSIGSIIYYALFAIPILLLYNGEKGKCNTKYFFYIFYPLHLLLLEGIYMLLYLL